MWGKMIAVSVFLGLIGTMVYFGFFHDKQSNAQPAIPQRPLPPGRGLPTAPEAMLAKIIIDLPVGQVTYINPDALLVDIEKRCWIDPSAVIGDTPTLVRALREQEGFRIWVTASDYRWVRVKLNDTEKMLLPVKEIVLLPQQQN